MTVNLTLLVAFLACFGGGPLVYVLVQRRAAGRGAAWAIAASVALLTGAALAADRFLGATHDLLGPAITLTGLWLAWVLTLALMARALDLALPDPALRRLALSAGLLATPLPWFGLAAAQIAGA